MSNYVFPDILLLTDHSGNWGAYNEAVYQIFKTDFVTSKPIFNGKRLGLKAYPLVEGKEYTYYHFTHDGGHEDDRRPNLRRMERIPFPKPIIENSTHNNFKVWRVKRGTKDRILLFCELESYLVVLEDRKTYILPWTAYLVDREHQRKKLLKGYEEYIKAEAAQRN